MQKKSNSFLVIWITEDNIVKDFTNEDTCLTWLIRINSMFKHELLI